MKQLEQHNRDEIVITEDKQQIKQPKFMGSFHPQKGQKVWQFHLVTNLIEEARYESISVHKGIHKKLVIKDHCIYTVALNIPNAKKKFLKMLIKMIDKK